MCAGQPGAELLGGFTGRGTVEGHQGGWHSRNADDVGAPAVGRDGGDLDVIGVTGDDLFEMMNGWCHDDCASFASDVR